MSFKVAIRKHDLVALLPGDMFTLFDTTPCLLLMRSDRTESLCQLYTHQWLYLVVARTWVNLRRYKPTYPKTWVIKLDLVATRGKSTVSGSDLLTVFMSVIPEQLSRKQRPKR